MPEQEEINSEKEGTQPYHKDTNVKWIAAKPQDLEPKIVQKELTQPHPEDTDDIVTINFVGNHDPHHKDMNGTLLKHKDLEPKIVQKE